ncbi:hypothetical protein DFH07DRAFT_768905 [Mycena maculata]|uniref:Uncharacterized protein n=1 Tax=Mycena maculata TaxID=230809 RepID=A0AAD7JQ69_9AGAR|nr:hypothetical protein DFH07DRAFT_768905 [Mycena maculata]
MLAGRLFFFFFLGGGGGGARRPEGRSARAGRWRTAIPMPGRGSGRWCWEARESPPFAMARPSTSGRANRQQRRDRRHAMVGPIDERRALVDWARRPRRSSISSVSSRRELAGTYQKFDVLPIHYPRESCAPESKAESAALGYCQYPEIGSEWKTNLDFEKMSKIMGS